MRIGPGIVIAERVVELKEDTQDYSGDYEEDYSGGSGGSQSKKRSGAIKSIIETRKKSSKSESTSSQKILEHQINRMLLESGSGSEEAMNKRLKLLDRIGGDSREKSTNRQASGDKKSSEEFDEKQTSDGKIQVNRMKKGKSSNVNEEGSFSGSYF